MFYYRLGRKKNTKKVLFSYWSGLYPPFSHSGRTTEKRTFCGLPQPPLGVFPLSAPTSFFVVISMLQYHFRMGSSAVYPIWVGSLALKYSGSYPALSLKGKVLTYILFLSQLVYYPCFSLGFPLEAKFRDQYARIIRLGYSPLGLYKYGIISLYPSSSNLSLQF